MQQNIFQLTNLIPNFSEIFRGTSHGLSALIVGFLLVVFVGFLAFALIKYFQAKKHVAFYIKLLSGTTRDQLVERQRAIAQAAQKNKEYGDLWHEFDGSLIRSPDGDEIYNTIDSSYYFNTSSLAKGLTENRLLAAVPGFLTAIGIIGTFAGLQMGLASLELSQEAGVDALRQGIGNMISGASIAFLTSVWGVFTSVTFNFLEKILERGIRKRIDSLQNRIDYLYPRINAEQSLITIADLNRRSNDALHNLAEKIGDRLQEVLDKTTNSISDGLNESLNKIMGPAIESLVNNANSGSQQALEGLIAQFIDGVGDAGKSQKQMMDEASTGVRESVGELTDTFKDLMNEFASKMSDQQNSSDQRDQQRQVQMTGQLNDLSQKNKEIVSNLGKEVTQQIEDQKNIDKARQLAIDNNMERVSGVLTSQKQVFDAMLQRFDDLHSQLDVLARAHSEAGKEVSKAAIEMQTSTNNLGKFSANIQTAADTLGGDILNATNTTTMLSQENRAVSKEMQQALEDYTNLRGDMTDLAETLSNAAKHAEKGLSAVNTHFDSFQKALNDHIKGIEDHLLDLLNGYSEQVKDQTENRLSAWNNETSQYISQMTNAVRTLGSVVSEMENRVPKGNAA